VRTRPAALLTVATVATVAAVALAVAGGAYLVTTHGDEPFRNSPEASRTLDRIDAAQPNGLVGATFDVDGPPLAAPASSPQEAVTGLLAALVARDAERSFSLLSEDDRAASGSFASWRDRLTTLPQVVEFQVTGAGSDEVTTDVVFEPRLDEVAGFVPAEARATWTTVEEDGGHRVAYSDSTFEPVLPSDATAAEAAQRWVTEQQACREGRTYGGNLLGQPTLTERLCGTAGAFRAGAAEELERFRDPTLVLNAFGADAATFVRVVPVDGPVPIQVALAPLSQDWEVIGVIQQ
jgi:hypothetical protein